MAVQDTLIPQKRRGPAPTGKGIPIMVRLSPEQLAALDVWISRRRDPNITRPEAIRRLIERGVKR